MEKCYLYLIVLTLFCLVEEIKAGISCRQSRFLKSSITCTPGHPKERKVTIKEIEDAVSKYLKTEDVNML